MKRPWFQFHLSTAIILMFVAAGLLWLNLNPPGGERWLPGFYVGLLEPGYWSVARGWPYTCWNMYGNERDSHVTWYYGHLTVDVVIAAGILVFVAVVCEWRIRRNQRTTNNKPRTTDNGPLTTDH